MTLHWTKEDDPRWDADKQRLFGPADLAAVDLDPPVAGTPVADEWWQVTGNDGQVAGYGWLDSESGGRPDHVLGKPGPAGCRRRRVHPGPPGGRGRRAGT